MMGQPGVAKGSKGGGRGERALSLKKKPQEESPFRDYQGQGADGSAPA